MPELTDMKLTKAEKKANKETYAVGESPDYSWGLCLNLDDRALKKLGVEELPDAGAEVRVVAVAKVTRASMSADEKAKSRSVEMQIVQLAVSFDDESDSFEKGFKS